MSVTIGYCKSVNQGEILGRAQTCILTKKKYQVAGYIVYYSQYFSYLSFVIAELVVKLRPLVSGITKEQEIKEAKAVILCAYHKHSATLMDPNHEDPHHSCRISRVHRTLCESIRRTDQILSCLLERRAVTQQERELIRSQTNDYQWVSHLLDVISTKPVSAYQCFLDALESTHQHHLCRLLECEGHSF